MTKRSKVISELELSNVEAESMKSEDDKLYSQK